MPTHTHCLSSICACRRCSFIGSMQCAVRRCPCHAKRVHPAKQSYRLARSTHGRKTGREVVQKGRGSRGECARRGSAACVVEVWEVSVLSASKTNRIMQAAGASACPLRNAAPRCVIADVTKTNPTTTPPLRRHTRACQNAAERWHSALSASAIKP